VHSRCGAFPILMLTELNSTSSSTTRLRRHLRLYSHSYFCLKDHRCSPSPSSEREMQSLEDVVGLEVLSARQVPIHRRAHNHGHHTRLIHICVSLTCLLLLHLAYPFVSILHMAKHAGCRKSCRIRDLASFQADHLGDLVRRGCPSPCQGQGLSFGSLRLATFVQRQVGGLGAYPAYC
jgi:hypothetical protein